MILLKLLLLSLLGSTSHPIASTTSVPYAITTTTFTYATTISSPFTLHATNVLPLPELL